MERRAWLTWEDIWLSYAKSRSAGIENVPATATSRERQRQELDCFYPELIDSSSLLSAEQVVRQNTGRGRKRAKLHLDDLIIEELAEAFWKGVEPKLRRKHPDLIDPPSARAMKHTKVTDRNRHEMNGRISLLRRKKVDK
jgi:hypothetical protein